MGGYFDRGATAGGSDEEGYFDREGVTGLGGTSSALGVPGETNDDTAPTDAIEEEAGREDTVTAMPLPDFDDRGVGVDETAGSTAPRNLVGDSAQDIAEASGKTGEG